MYQDGACVSDAYKKSPARKSVCVQDSKTVNSNCKESLLLVQRFARPKQKCHDVEVCVMRLRNGGEGIIVGGKWGKKGMRPRVGGERSGGGGGRVVRGRAGWREPRSNEMLSR